MERRLCDRSTPTVNSISCTYPLFDLDGNLASSLTRLNLNPHFDYLFNDIGIRAPSMPFLDDTYLRDNYYNTIIAPVPVMGLGYDVVNGWENLLIEKCLNRNRNGFDIKGGGGGWIPDGLVVSNPNSLNGGLYNRQLQPWLEPMDLDFLSIKNLRGTILSSSKDQNGCKILLKAIEGVRDENEIDMVLEEIIEHLDELMTEPVWELRCSKPCGGVQ